MKKRTRVSLAALALAGVLLIGGSLAYFTDTDSKTNLVTLGKVEGYLEETVEKGTNVEDNGNGLTYTDPAVPGKTVSKQPYVILDAKSEDAYVRVKINVTGKYRDGTAINPEVLDDLKFDINNEEGWYLGQDGYVYYQDVLSARGTTTHVFNTVTFPAEWGNEMAGASITIDVVGELIQADNFTPGTNAEGIIDSWGEVAIEDFQ